MKGVIGRGGVHSVDRDTLSEDIKLNGKSPPILDVMVTKDLGKRSQFLLF